MVLYQKPINVYCPIFPSMGFDNGIHYNPTIISIHGITGNFHVAGCVVTVVSLFLGSSIIVLVLVQQVEEELVG